MSKAFDNLLSTIKASTYLLGVIGISNALVSPVNAQQAVVRAAVTIVRPSGSYQSLSGEVTLPNGLYFDSGNNPTLTITPSFTNAGTSNESIQSLTISAGTPASTTTINSNPFVSPSGQTAPQIQNVTQIGDATALIKAGNGVQGLGALE